MFKWDSKKEVASNKERTELMQLNQEYTSCLAKDFLPAFLEGKNISVDNVCVDIRQRMLALDKKVYTADNF